MKRRLLMAGAVVAAAVIVYFLSIKQTESNESGLEGRVTLDGKPLVGAILEFRAEERSESSNAGTRKGQGPAINRYIYPSRSDVDGRYRVKLRPGLVYSISVRRVATDKETFKQADGQLPEAKVSSGMRDFDVALISPAPP
jgi:hypothetical protein